jgi:hypothetical protein
MLKVAVRLWFPLFPSVVFAAGACATWRGRDDPCNGFLGTRARFDALASQPALDPAGDRGRIVVRVLNGNGPRDPLEAGAVLALLRPRNGQRTDTVRFTERPAGTYSALLPAGRVPIAALHIGFERYSGTVSIRSGFADTVTLVLRAALICLQSSTARLRIPRSEITGAGWRRPAKR